MKQDIIPPRPTFEYQVIPAPTRGDRRKGLKSDDERMAYALTEIFNEMGGDGWEYVRTDTFTSASRADVTGTASRDHTLLVFRRSAAPSLPVAPAAPRPRTQETAPLLLTTPLAADAGTAPSRDDAIMDTVRAAVG